jgi:hypothetical protein
VGAQEFFLSFLWNQVKQFLKYFLEQNKYDGSKTSQLFKYVGNGIQQIHTVMRVFVQMKALTGQY